MTETKEVNVLLIEDNPGDARLLKELLKETPFESGDVFWFKSLAEGLDAYNRHSLDIVLCDLSLPDSTGLDTVLTLMKHVKENIPVVVLTGLENEEMGAKSISIGAQDYIIKNELTPALLSRTIRYSIERQKTENRERQLHSCLRTFRSVDQLITHVQDVGSLIKMACRQLVEMKGYECVWIVLTDEDGALKNIAYDGDCPFNESNVDLYIRSTGCQLMPCAKHVLEHDCVLTASALKDTCLNCPMTKMQQNGLALIRRMEYEKSMKGVLVAIVPEGHTGAAEERSLFSEIADAIAFAIHSLDLEKEKQQFIKALKQSEKRYSLIARNLPNGAVLILDEQLKIEFAQGSELENLEITGKNKKRSIPEIFSREKVEILKEYFNSTFKGNHESFEIEIKDSFFLFNTVPLRNHESKIEKILLLTVNITKQKEAEKEQQALENRLKHTEKLEAIGRLAGGVAHDFNNQLSAIMGYADLLKLQLKDQPAFQRYAEKIHNSSLRASDLTKQLLTYARKKEQINIPVNLHDIIREIIQLVNRTFDKRIVIDRRFNASKILTQGDPGSIQNAFLNLAINARDAMSAGGDLVIETSNAQLKARNALIKEFQIAPGEFCKVSFKDSGHGIKKIDLERIFEPFFTTKEDGKGTGMGLATVYGAVRGHNGAIEVKSQIGKGTDFSIYLPVLEAEEKVVMAEQEICYSGGDEKILVVDDEIDIRSMITDSLKLFGYQVEMVENGKKAIDYVKRKNHVDLIILDNDMPYMSGLETYHKLKEIKKEVKVIFMSGINKDFDTIIHENPKHVKLLNKPFTLYELSKMVHDVIT